MTSRFLKAIAPALLIAAAAVVATTSVRAQTQTLHLASTPWPPFTNVPGQARYAIDLVTAALQRIGITADTTIVDEGTLSPRLLRREFAGSAAMWRDAEREQTLLYSDAYLENRLILVARAGTDVSATSLSALAGKRVALVEGYSYGELVSKATGPVYVSVKGVEDSLQALLQNRADYTLMDDLVVEYLIDHYPQEAKARLTFGAKPLLVRSLHFALRRDLPDAQSIITRFNAALPGMVADRSYHRLLHIAWLEADIDGDGQKEFVPESDQMGPAAPTRGYELFTGDPEPTPTPRRFYLGGSIYEDWTRVPDAFKVRPAGSPTPVGNSTASIFTFSW